jgi:hypothetical protein
VPNHLQRVHFKHFGEPITLTQSFGKPFTSDDEAVGLKAQSSPATLRAKGQSTQRMATFQQESDVGKAVRTFAKPSSEAVRERANNSSGW